MGVSIPTSYIEQNVKAVASRLPAYVDFTKDIRLIEPPRYFIYVFNISRRECKVERPPSWPRIVFRACPPDREWLLVGKFPNVITESIEIPETGRRMTDGIAGERFVTDLLNPQNLGTDIWKDIADTNVTWVDANGGSDLTRRGLFWSYNEEPSAQELAMSKAKLLKHYHFLINQANDLARQNDLVSINQEHHAAAEYLKIPTTWHTVVEIPVGCPNCGDAVKPGVAFHLSQSIGQICVLDWKRAVAAGVKTKEQVPEEHRWWTDEPAPEVPEHRGPGRPRKYPLAEE